MPARAARRAPAERQRFGLQASLRMNCQLDYESFTDSWLPADMTPGGRIPHLWIRCADPQPWEHPKMTEFTV
jgi:hypothetical protein